MSDVERAAQAVARSRVAGGVVGYVQRIRSVHFPAVRADGLYTGCRCGAVGCGLDLLVLHIENLRHAYELKVQDLTRETARHALGGADHACEQCPEKTVLSAGVES